MSPTYRHAGPGRPARITRRAVAEAALAVGLDRATLVEVGRHLGVDHSSLYRHTSGRADMLQAAADIAIGSLDWERDTEDWRVYLVGAADAIWALFDRFPGLANSIRELETMPPSGVRSFCRACRRLEALGFTADQSVLIFDSVLDLTIDASCYAQRLRAPPKQSDAAIKRLRDTWSGEDAQDPAMAPMRILASAVQGDPRAWWRKKLGLLLDGAAAMHTSSRAAAGGPREPEPRDRAQGPDPR